MGRTLDLLALALGAGLVAGCVSGGTAETGSGRSSLHGVELTLMEIARDGQFLLPPDSQTPGRTKRAALSSKLRLSFDVPPSPDALVELPEWQALEEALVTLNRVIDDIRALNARARTLTGQTEADKEAWREELRRHDQEVLALDRYVLGTGGPEGARGIVSPEEALRIRDRSRDKWGDFGRAINAERLRLETLAREFARESDDYEVRVRALLVPELGDRQLLQVPDYYELEEDALESRLNSTQAQAAKLRAGFEAAQAVSGGFREAKLKGSAAVESWKTEMKAALQGVLDDLEAFLRGAENEVKTLLAGEFVGADLSGTKKAVQEALRDVQAEVQAVVEIVTLLRAFFADLKEGRFAGLLDLHDRSEELQAKVLALQARMTNDWPRILGELETSAAAYVAELARSGLETAFGASARSTLLAPFASLQARLPATTTAILNLYGTYQKVRQAVSLSEPLEDHDAAVPRPLDDLPPAEIDLKQNPVTNGDEIKLEVELWRRGESRTAGNVPVETVRYTTELVQAGWIWSGDVIFTKPTAGGDFIANAAVSREWRSYERDDPYSLWNRLDPRFGFHAAQLNQDPDETFEIGIGVNASLWGGLIRVGSGYNVNATDDEVYWYFGFGLIASLNQLGELDFTGKSD